MGASWQKDDILKRVLLGCIAGLTLSAGPAGAQDVNAFADCLVAMNRVQSYLNYLHGNGATINGRGPAALQADFLSLVEFGVSKFGEQAVRSLIEEVTDPDPVWIRNVLAIQDVDGHQFTFDLVAAQVAPCGLAGGNLRGVYGG